MLLVTFETVKPSMRSLISCMHEMLTAQCMCCAPLWCTYTEHLMSVIRGHFAFDASSSI